ncbi:MAG: hypothetical protein AAFV62_06360 [Pseudomonadota bacterium]
MAEGRPNNRRETKERDSFAWWLFITLITAVAIASSLPIGVRAQSLCEDPQAQCSRVVMPTCLQRLGAGSVAAADSALCDEQFAVYRSCLQLAAESCGAARPAPASAGNGAVTPTLQAAEGVQTRKAGDFEITLQTCRRGDAIIACEFVIANTGEEKRVKISANDRTRSAFLYHPDGTKYAAERLTIGRESHNRSINRTYPGGIPVAMVVEFQPDPFTAVEGSPLLQIGISGSGIRATRLDYRNVVFE